VPVAKAKNAPVRRAMHAVSQLFPFQNVAGFPMSSEFCRVLACRPHGLALVVVADGESSCAALGRRGSGIYPCPSRRLTHVSSEDGGHCTGVVGTLRLTKHVLVVQE